MSKTQSKNEKYDVFISYRREGGYETAQLLYDRLTQMRYRVSFDLETLRGGKFNTANEWATLFKLPCDLDYLCSKTDRIRLVMDGIGAVSR